MLTEPASSKSIAIHHLTDNHIVGWSRTSAIQLRYNPMLNPDITIVRTEPPPQGLTSV